MLKAVTAAVTVLGDTNSFKFWLRTLGFAIHDFLSKVQFLLNNNLLTTRFNALACSRALACLCRRSCNLTKAKIPFDLSPLQIVSDRSSNPFVLYLIRFQRIKNR
jgi:hypothetical protein